MRRSNRLALMAVGCALSFSVNAAVIYDVFDSDVVNCNGAPHGLWTSGDNNEGTCSNYFSTTGSFTFFNDDPNSDNWFATLQGTGLNPQSTFAQINLTFTGFEDAFSGYKEEGGAPYDPSKVDFFTDVSGTIDIGGDVFNITHFVDGTAFQFGLGANAKQSDTFGGSTWMQSPDMDSHHWDLNLNFIAKQDPNIVIDEPPTLLLLGAALMMAFIRKIRIKPKAQR